MPIKNLSAQFQEFLIATARQMGWSLIHSRAAVLLYLRPAIPAGVQSASKSKNAFASSLQFDCRKNISSFQSGRYHLINCRSSRTVLNRRDEGVLEGQK